MENNEMKKQKLLKKQLLQVEKRERKLLEKKENKLFKEKVAPVTEKLENKIPDKLQETLEVAFEKGFRLVFEKGTDVIERTYQKEDRLATYDIKNYALQRQTTRKNMKKLDQDASKTMWGNQLLSTIEGAGLGILGIGLPDIPILIGMILKSIYEMSLSYGFDYDEDREKCYILYLICMGVTKEEEQASYHAKLEELCMPKERVATSEEIWVVEDQVDTLSYSIEEAMREAAGCLARAMLLTKFIQGIPIVGVVGGISNWSIVRDITRLAKIKYKKRYLAKSL